MTEALFRAIEVLLHRQVTEVQATTTVIEVQILVVQGVQALTVAVHQAGHPDLLVAEEAPPDHREVAEEVAVVEAGDKNPI
jgi:hypothetical protein